MSEDLSILVVGTAGIDSCAWLPDSTIDDQREASFVKVTDQPGGGGYYLSAGFASLGWKVHYLGFKGDDELGDFLARSIAEAGVETHWLIDKKGSRRSMNLMFPDGSRKVFYDSRGASEVTIDLAEVEPILKGIRSVFLSIENSARSLIPLCEKYHLPIYTDLHDTPSAHDAYRLDFTRAASVIFSSAVNLSNLQQFGADINAVNPGAHKIIGMASEGCSLIRPNEGPEYFPAVDRPWPHAYANGAGDLLAVGVLTGRQRGYSWPDSILLGQTYARHSISQIEVDKKLLSWEQLCALSGLKTEA